MTAVATKAKVRSRKKLNKKVKSRKAKIREYISRFDVEFEAENDAVDLRKMSENYGHDSGIIPLEDIHRVIRVVLGEEGKPSYNIDPSGGADIAYPDSVEGPRLGYIDWEEAYLWPRFQRDVAPNHVSKINKSFDPSCVLVPNAIKVTVNGKVHYCIWDGHHTMQVCRLRGYKRFPVWYVDIDTVTDEEITAAGFNPKTERIDYLVYVAGRNMIMINSTNKRKLAEYDKFMIQLETKDPKTLSINDILTDTGCVPRRKSDVPGALTQYTNVVDCYDLTDKTGGNSEGLYLRRALQFHRDTWPMAPLELEIFRPMAIIYQRAAARGKPLDDKFDKELAKLLISTYGDPESVQLEIKDSFEEAMENNAGRGDLLTTNMEIVINGLINLYEQKVSRTRLPRARYIWTVV